MYGPAALKNEVKIKIEIESPAKPIETYGPYESRGLTGFPLSTLLTIQTATALARRQRMDEPRAEGTGDQLCALWPTNDFAQVPLGDLRPNYNPRLRGKGLGPESLELDQTKSSVYSRSP